MEGAWSSHIWTPVFQSEKNVPKMPVPFLIMYWHVEWYFIKRGIGHVSFQNLTLYVMERYMEGDVE